MVTEKTSGKVLGAYRLISSRFSKSFYSTTEFHMENILGLPGVKLELGRACIRKDYRNGMIISLLWRGICEYMKLTDTKYLFGCSSIDTTNPEDIICLHNYFSNNYYSPEHMRVYPKEKYSVVSKNASRSPDLEFNKDRVNIPPLLKYYLKAGAMICGEPALDNFFRCTDFFTVLDAESLNKSVERRYSKCV
jgi:putative hemolysin